MSGTDRIGIFIYGYGLGNSPSMINAGNTLTAEGFTVEFITCSTFIGEFEFNNPRISVHKLEETSKTTDKDFAGYLKGLLPLPLVKLLSRMSFLLVQLKGRLLDKLFQERRLAAAESSFLDDITRYINKAEEIIGNKRYKCFIGVEPEGLMAAALIGQKQSVPVIYYNLELHLSSESKTIWEKVLKKYEKKYNKAAALSITLDKERAQLLAEDNGTSLADILIVPVCAEGPRFEGRTDYLRKKLNIPDGKKIVLYAGFISEWAMCEEMAKAAALWPENRVLILHSHGYNDERYIEKIRKYEGAKVKVSLEPVPYDQLQSLLASADIGVALYRDLGRNFTLVSSASGKLAHYLKSGLPVITNDYPGMRKVIDKYRCGVCVSSPDEMDEAIKTIFDNYDTMRSNAYRCYEDNYMFSRQFAKVIEKIRTL